jgi:hypothetical protein
MVFRPLLKSALGRPQRALRLLDDLAEKAQCHPKCQCAVKGESTQPVSGPRRCRYALVATRAMARVTELSKLRGQRSASGGPASVRAATRVKPEQAPKG